MAEKSIEERLQRVEDFQQIQNIMGKYGVDFVKEDG